VGEFDGRVKYGPLPKPGQGIGDVLFDEKQREDALCDPNRLIERFDRAFVRGSRTF
jgi:hypothetical protein